MMVTTFYNILCTNINIKPNLKLNLWLWKGDLVDVSCVWKTNIESNQFRYSKFQASHKSHNNISKYDAHGFTITKSFNQYIPHHLCHAIIICDIHNACWKPLPLIPHWIPSSIMETKNYGINIWIVDKYVWWPCT